jgi:uncharacterized protein YaiL (DUF2058 family)
MSDLRDQLLKAGLVSDKEARKATHDKRVRAKETDVKGAPPRPQPGDDDETARALERQKARDRELNERARAEAAQKAGRLQERQQRQAALEKALREGVLPSWEGNRDYYFADGKTIQRLRVTEEAVRRLESGKAAIVRLPGGANGYTVLLAGAAEKLREADPAAIAAFHR